MLEKLTKEQQELIPVIRNKWLNAFYNAPRVEYNSVKDKIDWLYQFCGNEKPMVWIMDSPVGCQIAINILKNVKRANIGDNIRANIGANIWDNIRANIGANIRANIGANIWDNIWANIGDNIRANIWDNIRDNIWDNIRANIWDNIRANIGANIRANIWDNIRANIRANIWDNIRANIWDNIGANIWANIGDNIWDNIGDNYIHSCYYGNCGDYSWVSFWDYFQNCGFDFKYDWDNFNKFKSLLREGIYEIYPFKNICIICRMPKVDQDERNRLHCEYGPAVRFDDGFSMYYWHGLNVPDKWITDKESISKKDILEENNAERRRCLQEILGGEKFVSLLGCSKIDSDTDNQGNIMNLWKTDEPDSIVNKHIFYYDCLCPSTNRRYFLCVPECKNVWEAKSWTFRNEKIEIRHGDVGLINMSNLVNTPIFES